MTDTYELTGLTFYSPSFLVEVSEGLAVVRDSYECVSANAANNAEIHLKSGRVIEVPGKTPAEVVSILNGD
jgi:hypothetical protein